MSIKSFLPAAAAVAVAALALTGCTQNNATPAESSSSAPASSAPRGFRRCLGHPRRPAAPSAGAADTSAPITFDESNQHLTIPTGITKVIVNGSNNAIEGGSVADITVNGSNNDIHVEALTATTASRDPTIRLRSRRPPTSRSPATPVRITPSRASSDTD